MDNLTQHVLAKSKNKQKGGGTKKHKRNAVKCKFYREFRYRKNKLAKLSKHLDVHVNDFCAQVALKRLNEI